MDDGGRAQPAAEPQLDRLDATALTPIVRRALHSRAAVPVSWRWSAMPYAAHYAGRRLVRVEGAADVRGRKVSWMAVVKILTPPPVSRTGTAAPSVWDREARAYRSGLLERLPGGLGAPRVLYLGRAAHGDVWLWLEHVEDAFGGRWPLAHYGIAARHLGRFNGAYLGAGPCRPTAG